MSQVRMEIPQSTLDEICRTLAPSVMPANSVSKIKKGMNGGYVIMTWMLPLHCISSAEIQFIVSALRAKSLTVSTSHGLSEVAPPGYEKSLVITTAVTADGLSTRIRLA